MGKEAVIQLLESLRGTLQPENGQVELIGNNTGVKQVIYCPAVSVQISGFKSPFQTPAAVVLSFDEKGLILYAEVIFDTLALEERKELKLQPN